MESITVLPLSNFDGRSILFGLAASAVLQPTASQGLGALFKDIILGSIQGVSSNALRTVFGSPPTCCDNAVDGCEVKVGKSLRFVLAQ